MPKISQVLVVVVGLVAIAASKVRADAVVTDGRFTNVYVFPDPDRETWEQHLNSRPVAAAAPTDVRMFTRANIDRFTETLMAPTWPSFFDALHQYGGINPPLFFGSQVASQACVNAALHDLHNGVLEQTTIRSLANCHTAGKDPSPQVNLIFSPDIKIGEPTDSVISPANGADICSKSLAVLSSHTDRGVVRNSVTSVSNRTFYGKTSLLFSVTARTTTMRVGLSTGQRNLGRKPGKSGRVNLLDSLAVSTHLDFRYRHSELWSDAPVSDLQVWIQTGGDDLRGGNDNADILRPTSCRRPSP